MIDKDKYPFTVQVPAENVWTVTIQSGGYVHDECYNWLKQFGDDGDGCIFDGIIGGKWCQFSFKDEQDAALFRLWWG